MSSRIRIKGGPTARDMKVSQILDDGSEVEIRGITSMKVSELTPGNTITVELTLLDVELDLDMEAEVKIAKMGK